MVSGVMALRAPTSSSLPQPPQPLPLVQPLTEDALSALLSSDAAVPEKAQPSPNAARASKPTLQAGNRMVPNSFHRDRECGGTLETCPAIRHVSNVPPPLDRGAGPLRHF